jgi:antitoxin FitA
VNVAAIVIRRIDDTLKLRLRVRAAQHGRSMEEEVRVILSTTLGAEPPPPNLAAAIRARIEPLGGIELQLPERQPVRKPPKF